MATGDFTVKTAAQFRDDGLRTLRNGLIRAGVSNPNVAPGSDYYVLFQAIADELETISANQLVMADAIMPDTAEADDLDRWLAIVGLTRRPAGGSTGPVVFDSSAASPVPTGAELLDEQGLTYKVTTGGVYADGATIQIEAVSTGSETNLEAGDVLRWVTSPPYAASTVEVGTGGLINGTPAEDDETARARLLRRIGTPPTSGNWSQVAEKAEDASAAVQVAFVYPALEGASTQHVACAAYVTATNKSRAIAGATMTSVIAPYITGVLAEHSDVTVTTVTDVATDVGIYMSLPASPSAAVPGPGGGWLDGTPFPRPIAADVALGNCFSPVVAVTSTTRFTVKSDVAPTAGATRICWLSPLDWKLYTATVIAVNNGASPWDVTLDAPFVGIAAGHYISPQSVNQQAYFDAIVTAFAGLGPGEKTSNATVLARAYRRPTPNYLWPSSLGATQLRALSDVGDEVLDVQWGYRSTTTPAVPASVSDPPNILIVRNVGIYELRT